MSQFTKNPLSGQLSESAVPGEPSADEIAFHVQRGKQLHSKAVRDALFAGFCSIGKATDRAAAAIAQVFRKAGHSPS